MAKRASKRFQVLEKKVKATQKYDIDAAFKLVPELCSAKFDEGIDVAVNLGVDVKQGDQQVRGAVSVPHGLGKQVRVLVFAKGDKEKEAKAAGADFVGAEDLIEKINGGWMDFDKAIATPDMMVAVSKVARVLGPRGLMPNPKVGTVTFEVGKAVENEKKGKLDFRVDKAGTVHVSIGKKSIGENALKDNFVAFMQAVIKAKPATSKGQYLKSVFVAPTMGPSVAVDVSKLQAAAE